MTRKYTPKRWNYSQKAGKWVYVTINKDGKRKYKYQVDPPQEFVKLSERLKELSIKQANTEDPDENMRIFMEMRKLSEQMQSMRYEEN